MEIAQRTGSRWRSVAPFRRLRPQPNGFTADEALMARTEMPVPRSAAAARSRTTISEQLRTVAVGPFAASVQAAYSLPASLRYPAPARAVIAHSKGGQNPGGRLVTAGSAVSSPTSRFAVRSPAFSTIGTHSTAALAPPVWPERKDRPDFDVSATGGRDQPGSEWYAARLQSPEEPDEPIEMGRQYSTPQLSGQAISGSLHNGAGTASKSRSLKLHIDGHALGQWAIEHLTHTLAKPPTGMTGVDPRATPPRSRVSPF